MLDPLTGPQEAVVAGPAAGVRRWWDERHRTVLGTAGLALAGALLGLALAGQGPFDRSGGGPADQVEAPATVGQSQPGVTSSPSPGVGPSASPDGRRGGGDASPTSPARAGATASPGSGGGPDPTASGAATPPAGPAVGTDESGGTRPRIPPVVGQKADAAARILRDRGFTVSRRWRADQASRDTVVAVDPREGTTPAGGAATPVTLIVSSGPREVTTPPVDPSTGPIDRPGQGGHQPGIGVVPPPGPTSSTPPSPPPPSGRSGDGAGPAPGAPSRGGPLTEGLGRRPAAPSVRGAHADLSSRPRAIDRTSRAAGTCIVRKVPCRYSLRSSSAPIGSRWAGGHRRVADLE
ncbi:PASTA domain-containing protein [Frankia canadensis]|nr:PASTA domain-containing protein [Frankia canadensis]